MARTTAQDFIQKSFSPNIAVLSSLKVSHVMVKNNMSFVELLQPFTVLDWEGQFREPGGNICTVKDWKLIIKDVNWKPLQPTEARKQLNNAVLHNYNDQTISLDIGGHKCDMPQSTPWFDAWRETYLDVQFPSDHEFTKHFLSCILVGSACEDDIVDTFNGLNQQFSHFLMVSPPKLPKWFNNNVLKVYLLLHDVASIPKDKADSTFELLKQNFGANNCFMLTINSKNTLDSALNDYWSPYIKKRNELNNESTSVTISPQEAQATFAPVAQPADENSTIAEGLHPLTAAETDTYDTANSLHTYSLSGSSESVNVIGKNTDSMYEVYGAALNSNDIEAIKNFLKEFASKALLPYLEKQIMQLTEVVANRKGVSRSLLSATKRWFGTGKAGNTTGNNTVIYSNDCPELQLRRLGDLWFLCEQWQRAYDAYHTAKREFSADNAWLCYAGALEMAAISAFMAGEANKKTHAYMEESIITYLNTCRMVQYAVRATLLSVLCLDSSGLHGESARQLIRMTSEDSDLRSAMLLEQASLCFLSGPGSKAMSRKYAFHMVLAGHRFSKAGQKKHAYRCYQHAYQVYSRCGWRLATDHVQFALGRLAGALRLRAAVRWLAGPLSAARPPPHLPQQQDAFLREYMLAHQQWITNSEEYKEQLPVLPLPVVVAARTAALSAGPAPLAAPARSHASSLSFAPDHTHPWHKLEEMLLQVAHGTVPMIFKPSIDIYTRNTDANPFVPQGEPIQISITLQNPLKICLLLKDVELLWQFVPLNNADEIQQTISNEGAIAAGRPINVNTIHGQKHKSILLEENSEKSVIFSITPLCEGKLCIQGLAYRLVNAGEGGSEHENAVSIPGKIDLTSNENSKLLHIIVMPQAPCLQMTFSETSPNVMEGEMRSVDVEFRNVGPIDLCNLHLAVSHPDCVCLVSTDDNVDDFKVLYDEKYRDSSAYGEERGVRSASWRAACSRRVWRVPGVGGAEGAGLRGAGGVARARLLLRPRRALPSLPLLAYYEPCPPHQPRPHRAAHAYRLLRHVFTFNTADAIELTVTPRRSLRKEGEITLENMNLAVEIRNACSVKDKHINFEILDISMLSRSWKLTDLVSACNDNYQLKPREKLHVVLRGKRLVNTPPEGKIEWSCLKMVDDPASVDNINVPPYSKFITESSGSSIENVELNSTHNVNTKGMIQSMVVVRWRAREADGDEVTIGQHNLWLDCFSKVRSSEGDIATADAPVLQLDESESKLDLSDASKKVPLQDDIVIFRMEHPKSIVHDFNENKLCVIPITMNIVNCYGVPVEVFIDMSKSEEGETNKLQWVGGVQTHASGGCGVAATLSVRETRRVAVRAVCAAPGAYALTPRLAACAPRPTSAAPALSLPLPHTDTAHATHTSLLIVKPAA